MIEVVKFIGGIFVELYNAFNIKIFSDMPVTLSQLFIGILAFVVFINFFKAILGVFATSTRSVDFYSISKKAKTNTFLSGGQKYSVNKNGEVKKI